MTDAAEDAAEADGGPLRNFKKLLWEFIGESSNNEKRDEKILSVALKILSVALEKAKIPHRIRVRDDRITLYAVTDRGEWKAASNATWSAQYELQTTETGVRRPTFLAAP